MNVKNYISKLKAQDSRVFRLLATWLMLVILISINTELKASHIVGGHLTYSCLNGNAYEITLVLRRDCDNGAETAPFDEEASVGIFDGFGNPVLFIGLSGQFLIDFNGDDTITSSIDVDCSIIGNPVCVHEAVYKTNVKIPFNSKF